MAVKKGVLGRGLDAILVDTAALEKEDGAAMVRISEIEPNAEQPRKRFDSEELASLAESISEYGVLQPITVRKTDSGYQIIAGERRWRAARMAGLSEVPVIIVSADDKRVSEISLVENIQRKDLNPIEEAEAFEALINDFGLTQEEVGRRIGRSRSSVTNTLRLLDLPKGAREKIIAGTLSEGHAKVLLGMKDEELIEQAANIVCERDLSVRETEKLVKLMQTAPVKPTEQPKTDLDYTKQLERSLYSKLGRTVKIVQKGEKSTINIGFTDNNDLETILRLLCGNDFVNNL